MKKWILFICCHLFTLTVMAQTATLQWAKKLGGSADNSGQAIGIDAAGCVYTAGSFAGTIDADPGPGTYPLIAFGPHDAYISKLDATGQFVWAKRVGGNGEDMATALHLDSQGYLYITGFFEATADLDPSFGVYPLTSAGGYDIFILKLDTAGNFTWAKQVGGIDYDMAWSITANATNVFITGDFEDTVDFDPGPGVYGLQTHGNQGYGDVFVLKLDTGGNLAWAKNMGGGRNDRGFGIAVDALGNVYTCGDFYSGDFDPGPGTHWVAGHGIDLPDAFISKLDANGDFLWAKGLGANSYDAAQSIAVDNWGNVYTTGTFDNTVNFNTDPGGSLMLTPAGANDIFVMKLTTAGNFVWAGKMGGPGNDFGFAIATDAAGNVYTTGYFGTTSDLDPGAGVYNLTCLGEASFISKLDSAGHFMLAENLQGNDTGSNHGCAIALDGANNIYSTGRFYNRSDFDPGTGVYTLTAAGGYDAFVHKMTQEPLNVTSVMPNYMLSVHPNPSNGLFYISYPSMPSDAVIEITNTAGVLIAKEKTNNDMAVISLQNAASGLYFARLISKGETIAIKKLLKQ